MCVGMVRRDPQDQGMLVAFMHGASNAGRSTWNITLRMAQE